MREEKTGNNIENYNLRITENNFLRTCVGGNRNEERHTDSGRVYAWVGGTRKQTSCTRGAMMGGVGWLGGVAVVGVVRVAFVGCDLVRHGVITKVHMRRPACKRMHIKRNDVDGNETRACGWVSVCEPAGQVSCVHVRA